MTFLSKLLNLTNIVYPGHLIISEGEKFQARKGIKVFHKSGGLNAPPFSRTERAIFTARTPYPAEHPVPSPQWHGERAGGTWARGHI